MKKTKKLLAIVMCMVMMMSFTVTVWADSEYNGFVYNIISGANVVEITGFNDTEKENVDVPYAIGGMSVVQIGQSAFMNNATVRNMTFSKNLLGISDNAMYGMKALESVTLPQNLKILGRSAFSYCSALESVNFETNSLSVISDYTFYGCTKLNRVILPNSVVEIGDYSFAQCMSLDKIYIPRSVSVIADTAFYSTKNGLTIYGYKNSQAYYYALNNKIQFVNVEEKSLDEIEKCISDLWYMAYAGNHSLYTETSVNAFIEAYQNAVAVKNDFFSKAEEVTRALNELNDSYYALRLKSMDTLDTLIAYAEDKIALSFQYTESSVSVLDIAINQAKTVQNTVLPSESQVQDSIKNLNDSINSLDKVMKYDINSDSKITLSDIVLVHKKLLNDYVFSQREIYLVDFNNDNEITLADIVLFQRYFLTNEEH